MMLAASNRRHSSTRECSASWCYIRSSLGFSTDIANLAVIYISMMGSQDLTDALRITILNANYMAKHLENHYPVLFCGVNGTCAHEFIIDMQAFKESVGVEAEDVAKEAYGLWLSCSNHVLACEWHTHDRAH
ncbi:unnamed protein product [Sphagnum jensenii]|uniref:Glycine dehydrogenase C-terminal domain-containing protein n=1 Tax=Sphagnum jensenii TaxID=128206 RepID=A0ABP1B556_9BRYO